jgi:hypothetical protein
MEDLRRVSVACHAYARTCSIIYTLNPQEIRAMLVMRHTIDLHNMENIHGITVALCWLKFEH